MIHSLTPYETAEIIQPGGRPVPETLEQCMRVHYIPRGDIRLRVMLASAPVDDPRGTVILSIGRTEFIEKYFETASDFIRRGFNVLIVDPRGQGLSSRLLDDKLKSYVDSFQDYADDLAFVVHELAPLLPKPHILVGHSMGGTVALQCILSGVLNPSAIICSAPMLGLFDLNTGLMKWTIRLLSALGLKTSNLPFQIQRNGLPVPFSQNKLTSDRDRYRHWAAYFQTTPRLRVGPPTLGWIVAGIKAMDFVNRNATELNTPNLTLAAGADPIVDPSSNEIFAHRSKGRYYVVAGAKHELFLERDVYRQQFFEQIDAFLDDEGF